MPPEYLEVNPGHLVPRIKATQANASGIRRFLRRLTQPIQSFQQLLSNARAVDRAHIPMPDEFVKAWLHLLMGLIYSTQEAHLWREHTDNAETLVKTGMRKVIEGLSTYVLLDRAAVRPLELVSLVCLELFNGITAASHRDISETYYDYLQALVSVRNCGRRAGAAAPHRGSHRRDKTAAVPGRRDRLALTWIVELRYHHQVNRPCDATANWPSQSRDLGD